jgi:DNA-binding transcriptional ArsR family regulator
MNEIAELFKVLSVDTRIKIVELLKKGPMTVNALAEELGISQSAVSQQLRILKSSDIVRNKREGYWVHYSINEETLIKCRDKMASVCTCGCEGSLPALQKYRDALTMELKEVEKKIAEME